MTAPSGDVPPRLSAVVVSYNTRDDLLRCLASLEAGVSLPMETIVVDNASADGSAEAVRLRFPRARLLQNDVNVGFAAAVNRGLKESRGPYALVLNSDAEVRPGAVETMAGVLDERPDVGVVGPRTVSADGLPQVSFGPPLSPLAEWRQRRLVNGVRERRPEALRRAEEMSRVEHEPAWVSASCLLARRQAFEAAGYFDEGFFLYEEDADLCLRVRSAGWRILYTPRAEVVHHLGRSAARDPGRAGLEYHRSHLRYYRKHNGPLLTALLRLYLGARAALGWIAAPGAGETPRLRRGQSRRLLILALRGW